MRLPKLLTLTVTLVFLTTTFAQPAAQAHDLTPCRIQKLDATSRMSIGWPKSAASLPSIGSVNILVMAVDFENAIELGNTEQILKRALRLDKATEYFKQVSGGLFNPNFVLFPNLVKLPFSSSYYGDSPFLDTFVNGRWSTEHLAQGAIDIVQNSMDLSQFDAAITLVSGGSVLSGNAAYAFIETSDQDPNKSDINRHIIVGQGAMNFPNIESWKVIAHELNHLLGIADLYLLSEDGWWQGRSTGPFGIQSSLAKFATDSLGWERWLLNWIPDPRIYCQGRAKTQKNLSMGPRAANSSATELFIVNLSPTKVLAVEALTHDGYESSTYPDSVLVYTVDSAIPMGEGPVRIIPHPTKITLAPLSSAIPDWNRFQTAPLKPGEYVRYENFLILNNAKIKGAVSISFFVGKDATRKFKELETLKNAKVKMTILCRKGTKVKKVTSIQPKCLDGYRKQQPYQNSKE